MGKKFKKVAAPAKSDGDVELAIKAKKAPKRKADVEDEVEKEDVEMNDEEHMEQQEEDEDDFDSEDDDDEDEEESEDELMNENGEKLDFDFEAFPMEEGDAPGIVNMLTQIFLRADVDCAGMAKALIEQAPFGTVVGPADDQDDEEETDNVVYGVASLLPIDASKEDQYQKDVIAHFLAKAKKNADKEALREFESALAGRVGWFINERMLNFPAQIAPPVLRSLSEDIAGLPKSELPTQFLYVQKLRIADPDPNAPKAISDGPSAAKKTKGKKKKMGKAEKKRVAAAARELADVEFDNPEDECFEELPGKYVSFDYNVQNEVEVGSKFHNTHKDGKTLRPYRRAILMDKQKLDAFLAAVACLA